MSHFLISCNFCIQEIEIIKSNKDELMFCPICGDNNISVYELEKSEYENNIDEN